MFQPVLLVAPDPAGTSVAQELRNQLGLEVSRCTGVRDGSPALRREDFGLVLLDENLAAAEPLATEALYAGAVTVPVLEINFALCNPERVVRQVRTALKRRAHDEAKARTAAAAALGNELNASLTGLLLESQLALPGAPPELAQVLHQLIELAAELRTQLRS